jgi:hypothetical protein
MLSSAFHSTRAVLEKKYDARFHAVFDIDKTDAGMPIPAKRAIGFHSESKPMKQQK